MKHQGPHFRVAFRRRREGKTDYRRRQKLLRSPMPRAVVRKTLNQTLVQIVEEDAAGDRVLASARSLDLKEHGWSVGTGNVPAAYLTGYLAGKRAIAQGVKGAVLDIGVQQPTRGGRVFAALQGLLDAGVQVPHSKEILPDKERIRGEHIGEAVVKSFEAVKAKLEAA
ncbi:MAG TPA: 50S ribosomal protein L18 [Thermoplasmata archaeon]|nr:50S ribosomal protein L18 [Thermoplasmata archaeon]